MFFLTGSAHGQQVANYSFGKAGAKSYEHFSFWALENKRGEITYSYGKVGKEIELTYLGTDTLNGEPCFKVQFPNQHVLYIIPKGLSLKVIDGEGKYSKHFRWQYEGPVDGVGTFCDACAEDEKAAMKLIRKHFMK